jgi:hypothetical protein
VPIRVQSPSLGTGPEVYSVDSTPYTYTNFHRLPSSEVGGGGRGRIMRPACRPLERLLVSSTSPGAVGREWGRQAADGETGLKMVIRSHCSLPPTPYPYHYPYPLPPFHVPAATPGLLLLPSPDLPQQGFPLPSLPCPKHHSTTLRSATLRSATLHFAPLHYTTLHYTTNTLTPLRPAKPDSDGPG